MSRSDLVSTPRAGFSLVEILLALAILLVALVPILSLYGSSHRIAHSARRLADVTLHGQAILEALAQLSIDEFPPLPNGAKTVLLADGGGATAGGGPRFAEVVTQFGKPPPLEMERVVKAERLATGQLLFEVTIVWNAVVGEKATEQTITLPMLATPRNWQ